MRWWPGVVIVVLALVVMWTMTSGDGLDQQMTNVRRMLTGIGAAVLILTWLVGFSRLPARRRIVASFGFLAALGSLFLVFRFTGVDGNLVPTFELRWAGGRTAALPADGAVPAPAAERVAAPAPGAAPFLQFFGPHRLGKLSGPVLAADWDRTPPTELWRRPVGAGWSGFAVAGRRAITHEQHGPEEVVVCYELLSGTVLWTRRVTARYDNAVAGLGPRTTPTIHGDRVFTLGGTGVLECLELSTGKAVWTKNICTDNGAPVPEWGMSGSPLWSAGRIVVGAGGAQNRSLVAYDAATGAFVWGGGTAPMHWSSPVEVELGGRRQILLFHGDGVSGHDPEDGRVLWTHGWKGQVRHPHVCMPIVLASTAEGGDRVCISSGYGTGSEVIEFGGPGGTPRSVWKNRRLKSKFANILEHEGFIYGLDDGIFACLDAASGKRRWKGGRYGHGQFLLVDRTLLVTTEDGAVVLLAADPEQHRELARLEVFDRKTWNPPALAGEYLLVRNDREAVCLRLPVREPKPK